MLSSTNMDCMDAQHRYEGVAGAVSDHLRQSPYPALHGVSFEFRRGVLFLRGRLPSYYHKQLAQETVSRVQGVGQVVNETEVAQPATVC